MSNRDGEAQQVAEVLARLASMQPGDKPLALVTHQVIVTAVTGVYPQSGEVVVKVTGSIKPDDAK